MKLNALTTKLIRQWLKENDFNCGCRLGSEFAYDPCEYFITVSRNYDPQYDSDFMAFLRGLGMKTNFDVLTLSILHELGHFETLDTMSEKEYAKDIAQRENVISYITDNHKRNFTYWNLKSEYMANEWLVFFCENYPNKVQELEDMVWSSVC